MCNYYVCIKNTKNKGRMNSEDKRMKQVSLRESKYKKTPSEV